MLEPTFLLMYYMGFSYKEAYHLPVPYKRWFIDRVVKELNRSGGGTDDDPKPPAESRALHANTPDVRSLQGRQRAETPSRLRRFT